MDTGEKITAKIQYPMPSTQNLFLIGMMGSWKSTVGRKLAVALDLEFIDTDDAIEEVTEMKVADLFQEFGEEKFREMETAFFCGEIQAERTVILNWWRGRPQR